MSDPPYIVDPLKDYFQNSLYKAGSMLFLVVIIGIIREVSTDKHYTNDVIMDLF